MLGKEKLIDSKVPYFCDGQVQLVCKYLKAMKENTLDQAVLNGKDLRVSSIHSLICITGNREGARIGSTKMLTNEDCCSLLNEYMPPHVRLRKITQKLYIRLILYYVESSLHATVNMLHWTVLSIFYLTVYRAAMLMIFTII